MTTTKFIILAILTLLGLTSCNPNFETIFFENNEKFDQNRQVLNNVIVNIEKVYVSNWDKQKDLFIHIDSMDTQTKNTLKELGIESVELQNNPNDNCKKNYWITLNVIVNWNIESLKVVQIIYAPCDKHAEKNYHYSDGYHRDFWGQGDNWFIYSDTDFI